jgi:hypothetical protein
MTNTLHRFGDAASFEDDYIVIAIPAKGATGQGDSLPRLKRFLQIALEYGPVNLGDAMNGGAFRPTRHRYAIQHFMSRPTQVDFQAVIDGITKPTTFAAIFDKRDSAEGFVRRLKEEDLGLSINVSSSLSNGLGCCQSAGIVRHSVGYSLGFEGMPDNIPNRHVVMLATMCGHGLISQALAKKMIDFVKEDRRTPDEAVATLGRFCSCGIFNPSRARRIIEDARTKAF